jgi:hypothetical protein
VPGRRQRNFRSGDLSECLGLYLLKGIAAVAEVARPEDVGIDAVATLLRHSEDSLLYAEDSFYVQIKSSSDRKISYSNHEVRWLEQLKLPLFIASISKETSAIELYATHWLSQVLLEMHYKEITLHLDRPSHFNTTVEKRDVYLGWPLLKWSTEDITSSTLARMAYSVLKPYLTAEQRNIDHRNIRYIEQIQWKTNEVPVISKWANAFGSARSKKELFSVFISMQPHLFAMAMNSVASGHQEALEAILHMVSVMRDSGYDPDPSNIYQAFKEIIIKRPSPQGV